MKLASLVTLVRKEKEDRKVNVDPEVKCVSVSKQKSISVSCVLCPHYFVTLNGPKLVEEHKRSDSHHACVFSHFDHVEKRVLQMPSSAFSPFSEQQ